ncbi:MAG: flavodoxin family protein [Clostridia bacterium]|nr:flavodoxin family protein [Clostridia bacterium]
MKVLLVNGSPNKNGCTYTALNEIAVQLEKEGVQSEILYLGADAINDCMACGYCSDNNCCVINDVVNEVAQKLDQYDGFVFGAPVYYAAPASRLTSFLDRLFFSAGSKMQCKPGCAVVSCRRAGASASLDRINKYFTINNMPVVSSSYWNMVHGSEAEDVLQDAEGLHTMRTLAQNMAWLIKCINAGKQAGIDKPEYQEKEWTNFIR